MRHRPLFIFIGPPGSGKGTTAQLCVQRLRWQQFSTGNLCRWHIAESTEIGKKIDFIIKSGKLVPDKLVTSMVSDWLYNLSDEGSPIILDGYPRTMSQVYDFDNIVLQNTLPFAMSFVSFVLDDQKVIDRIKARFVCKNKACQIAYSTITGSLCTPRHSGKCDKCNTPLGQRCDDTVDIIKERLRVFHAYKEQILKFLHEKKYVVHTINANCSAEDVFKQLCMKLGEKSDFNKE